MRFATSIIALAASSLVSAAPFRRAATAQDLLVLSEWFFLPRLRTKSDFNPAFAHVLEQFETQFYTQALSKFQQSDFTSAGFSDAQVPIEQFTAIQGDESTHTTVLAVRPKSMSARALVLNFASSRQSPHKAASPLRPANSTLMRHWLMCQLWLLPLEWWRTLVLLLTSVQRISFPTQFC